MEDDSPRKLSKEEEEHQRRRRLSTSSSNGSTNSSPEFEFWMTRNPSSIPQPDQLLSADELFLDGVVLPLHLLHSHHHHHQNQPTFTTSSQPLPPEKEIPLTTNTITSNNTSTSSSLGGSKRWKDMLFKKTLAPAQNDERVKDGDGDKDKEKEKKAKKKKKKGGGVSGSGAAELNIINIWPFSRSRSAGNGSTRPKLVPPGSTRKVSSAPCSRSNSSGENKCGKKCPNSPGRVNGGVYLGRTSPVWQVRPNGSGLRTRSSGGYSEPLVGSGEKDGRGKKQFTEPSRHGKLVCTTGDDYSSGNCNSGASNKVKILNLNVPKCVGYRSHHLSCRCNVKSALIVNSGGDLRVKNGDNDCGSGKIGSGSGGGNPFNLRSLFTKKVY